MTATEAGVLFLVALAGWQTTEWLLRHGQDQHRVVPILVMVTSVAAVLAAGVFGLFAGWWGRGVIDRVRSQRAVLPPAPPAPERFPQPPNPPTIRSQPHPPAPPTPPRPTYMVTPTVAEDMTAAVKGDLMAIIRIWETIYGRPAPPDKPIQEITDEIEVAFTPVDPE